MQVSHDAILVAIANDLCARHRDILLPVTWYGDAWGALHESDAQSVDWCLFAANDGLHVQVNTVRDGSDPDMIYCGSWTME